jgi:putative MATE family efflux protein
MDRKFGTDLSIGSIPRHLLSFAIPMLIGNAIQVAYSIINTIWVGHLVGENAVGSIGVSFPVILILIGFSMGITLATTILVAQYYGAKNLAMVEKVVNNSFSLSLIMSIVLAVAGILTSDSILRIIDTPPENFEMASGYLKISLINFIPIYLIFLTSSILRGIGDTVTPLMFMAIGVGLNAILDPFLIGGFGPFPFNGLNGAAYASLIAQTVATLISIIYLNRKDHIIAFNPKNLILNRHMTFMLFKIGFPSIIQQLLISLGAIFIVSFVNAFGNAATNAFGAVQRVEIVAFLPAMSMSMAVATLTGQNLGAGKPYRVKEIFKWGVIMCSSMTILIALIVVLFPKYIFIIFGIADDAKVLEIGTMYLRIVGSSYIFLGIFFISNGIINGSGHTIITMCFTILSLWLVRVPLSWLLSKTSLGIMGIWIAVAFSFALTMAISLTYYFSGRWKKSVIIKSKLETQTMGAAIID